MKRDLSQRINYDQCALLDAVRDHLGLKRDVDLARLIGVNTANICNMRRRQQPLGASVLVRLHEASGISIKQLRALMGDHRDRWQGLPGHPEKQAASRERTRSALST